MCFGGGGGGGAPSGGGGQPKAPTPMDEGLPDRTLKGAQRTGPTTAPSLTEQKPAQPKTLLGQ